MARQVRDREIADLHFQAAQHGAWQRDVENAARNTIAQQQREALVADLERHVAQMTNPPQSEPEPEPTVVYVSEDEAGSPHLGDRDFNPKLWAKKRPWF